MVKKSEKTKLNTIKYKNVYFVLIWNCLNKVCILVLINFASLNKYTLPQ